MKKLTISIFLLIGLSTVASAANVRSVNTLCFDNQNRGITVDYIIRDGYRGDVLWTEDYQEFHKPEKCVDLTHLAPNGKWLTVWYHTHGTGHPTTCTKNNYTVRVSNKGEKFNAYIKGAAIFNRGCWIQ